MSNPQCSFLQDRDEGGSLAQLHLTAQSPCWDASRLCKSWDFFFSCNRLASFQSEVVFTSASAPI